MFASDWRGKTALSNAPSSGGCRAPQNHRLPVGNRNVCKTERIRGKRQKIVPANGSRASFPFVREWSVEDGKRLCDNEKRRGRHFLFSIYLILMIETKFPE